MKLQHLIIEKLAAFLEFQPTEKLLQDGVLSIDGLTVRVNQIPHAEGAFVALSAAISPLDAQNLQSVLTLAMSANHFWRGTAGATFSYDPMTEQLFLSCQFTQDEVVQMKSHNVGEAFSHLFETAKHWQAVISQLDFNTELEPLNARRAHALSFGMAASRFQ